MRRLWWAATLLGLVTAAGAQTPSKVSLLQAQFHWSWAQGTGGPVESFVLQCGTLPPYVMPAPVPLPDDGVYTQPIQPVVGTSGTYTCTVLARNGFGDSPRSPGVTFQAGLPPVQTGPLGTR